MGNEHLQCIDEMHTLCPFPYASTSHEAVQFYCFEMVARFLTMGRLLPGSIRAVLGHINRPRDGAWSQHKSAWQR